MRSKTDIENYQASIKLLLERAKDEVEFSFYLGIYNALEWVGNDKVDLTTLHYKLNEEKIMKKKA